MIVVVTATTFIFTGGAFAAKIDPGPSNMTIEQVKEQIASTAFGNQLLQQFNSSGDSTKTLSIVKRFFSSSFGILSDLYIVALIAIFFIVSPKVYTNGMIKLLPVKAKEKALILSIRLEIF